MFLWRSSQKNNLDEDDSLLQQDAKVKEVRESLGQLSERETKFCTEGCLRRYLQTTNWDVCKAKKMLEDTLKWRASYKPDQILWNEVAHEGETGKCWRANFHDRQGRTVIIMGAGKQNTKGVEGSLRHFVYTIENGMMNLPEGEEQLTWLVDFTGFSINSNVPLRLAREIINVIQNHYPDTLTVGLLYDPPKIFEAFWKGIKYFLNSRTYKKIKFVYPKNKESVELMRFYFDAENLPKEFGGNVPLVYNHEDFSKLMIEDDKKIAEFWGSS